MALMRKK